MKIFEESANGQQSQVENRILKKSENEALTSPYKLRLIQKEKKAQRYECFCFSQYLSYSALYAHLKKKHLEFFELNRQFYKTNTIVTVDPVYGYEIKKLLKERVVTSSTPNGKGKSKAVPNEFAEISHSQRPQYEFNAIQLQIAQSLKNNEMKKRALQISEKILQKQGELIEELEGIMKNYEGVLRLLGIREVSNAAEMKREDLSESQEAFYPDE